MWRVILHVCSMLLALNVANGPRHCCAQGAIWNWDDDGGSANKDWSNPFNWDRDLVPGFTSNVAIGSVNAYGDITIVDSNFNINRLDLYSDASVVNSPDGGATTFELAVQDNVSLSNAGTFSAASMHLFRAPPNGESLDAGSVYIHVGNEIRLQSEYPGGGPAILEAEVVWVNGTLSGNGLVRIDSEPFEPSLTFDNSRNITAEYIGPPTSSPPATTLHFMATHPNSRIDLDGEFDNTPATITVGTNATLDIDIPLDDAFNSLMILDSGSTLDIQDPWSLDNVGVLDVNATASSATIAGGTFILGGGNIKLDSASNSLRLNSPLLAIEGTIANSGHITFNADAVIGAVVDFYMNGGSARITVANGVDVTISDGTFDLDGIGAAGNVTTIGNGGQLSLNINFDQGDDDLHQPIVLTGGTLSVTNTLSTSTDTSWSLASTSVVDVNSASNSSRLQGSDLRIVSTININAGARLLVTPTSTTLAGSADINIASGGELNINGPARYISSGISISGSGTFHPGDAQIGVDASNPADIVWSTATVNFDDGNHTINEESSLTINATAIETSANDGADNAATIHEGGLLTVNLSGNANMRWDSGSSITYFGDSDKDVFLAEGSTGTAHEFAGDLVVHGLGQIDAEMHFLSDASVTVQQGSTLYLDGQTHYEGGSYRGATIHQNGSANVVATTILGTNEFIAPPVGGIPAHLWLDEYDWDGTDSASAITNIAAGTTFVINAVKIESDPSTDGYGGTVNINGGTLVVNTGTRLTYPAGPPGTIWPAQVAPSTWRLDGTMNLREVDGNAAVVTTHYFSPLQIHGTVNAISGDAAITPMGVTLTPNARINVLNGANLTLGPGSGFVAEGTIDVRSDGFLRLNSPSSLRATLNMIINGVADLTSTATILGGTYQGDGILRFKGSANFTQTTTLGVNSLFAAGGTTTIATGQELQLANNGQVQAGAIIQGEGTLRNLFGSELSLLDDADLDVNVINEGTWGPGSSPGTATVKGMTQTATGNLEIEIGGTGEGEFDVLIVDNQAQLGGTLDILFVEPTPGSGLFTPSPGDSFQFLTAGSFTGAFSNVTVGTRVDTADGMGSFLVSFDPVSSSFSLSEFVEAGIPGDYNNDGIVNAADYTIFRDTRGQTGAGLAADGDHSGMVDDLDRGVWAANFGNSLNSGAGDAPAVPEPSTMALAAIALCISSQGSVRDWITRLTRSQKFRHSKGRLALQSSTSSESPTIRVTPRPHACLAMSTAV